MSAMSPWRAARAFHRQQVAGRRGHDREASAIHDGPAVEALAGRQAPTIDSGVQDVAWDIGDPSLRTLDALRLASALLLARDLTAFVPTTVAWSTRPKPSAWWLPRPARLHRSASVEWAVVTAPLR